LDENEDQKISAWYNMLSPSYDELYGEEQASKHDRVMDFVRREKLTILLDIGCGSGRFLERARRMYDYGVGIDLSIGLLRIAKKLNREKNDLILATQGSLPIKNGSVDCIVSISTLKADSLQECLTEIRRVQTPKCILALSVFQTKDHMIPRLLSDSERIVNVSERETLYCLRSSK
jgi:ubiquinone/menaquinone biosynthesis C-methylase UbiE